MKPRKKRKQFNVDMNEQLINRIRHLSETTQTSLSAMTRELVSIGLSVKDREQDGIAESTLKTVILNRVLLEQFIIHEFGDDYLAALETVANDQFEKEFY